MLDKPNMPDLSQYRLGLDATPPQLIAGDQVFNQRATMCLEIYQQYLNVASESENPQVMLNGVLTLYKQFAMYRAAVQENLKHLNLESQRPAKEAERDFWMNCETEAYN